MIDALDRAICSTNSSSLSFRSAINIAVTSTAPGVRNAFIRRRITVRATSSAVLSSRNGKSDPGFDLPCLDFSFDFDRLSLRVAK